MVTPLEQIFAASRARAEAAARAKAAAARAKAAAAAKAKAAAAARARIAAMQARIAAARAAAKRARVVTTRPSRPGAYPGGPSVPPPPGIAGPSPIEIARQRAAAAKAEAARKAAEKAKRKAEEARKEAERKRIEERKRQAALRRSREAKERLEKIKEMARRKREQIKAKAAPTPIRAPPTRVPAKPTPKVKPKIPLPAPLRKIEEIRRAAEARRKIAPPKLRLPVKVPPKVRPPVKVPPKVRPPVKVPPKKVVAPKPPAVPKELPIPLERVLARTPAGRKIIERIREAREKRILEKKPEPKVEAIIVPTPTKPIVPKRPEEVTPFAPPDLREPEFVGPPPPEKVITPIEPPIIPLPPPSIIEQRLIAAGREKAAQALYKKRTGRDLPPPEKVPEEVVTPVVEPVTVKPGIPFAPPSLLERLGLPPPKKVVEPEVEVPVVPEKVVTPTEPPVTPPVPTERVPFVTGLPLPQALMQTEKAREIMGKLQEAREKAEQEKAEKYEQMLASYTTGRERLIKFKEQMLDIRGIPEEQRERMMGFVPPEARDIRTHHQLQKSGITRDLLKLPVEEYNTALSNVQKGINEMKAADPSMTYQFEGETEYISRNDALKRLQDQFTEMQNNPPSMTFEKTGAKVDLTQKGAYGKLIKAYQNEQEAQVREYYDNLLTVKEAYQKAAKAKDMPEGFVGPIHVTEEELGEHLQLDPEISQIIFKYKLLDKYKESMINKSLGKKDTSGFEKAYEQSWIKDMKDKGFDIEYKYDREQGRKVPTAVLGEDAEMRYAKKIAEEMMYEGKHGGPVTAFGTTMISYHDPLGLVSAFHSLQRDLGFISREEAKKRIIETKGKALYDVMQSKKKGVAGMWEHIVMKSPITHVGMALAAPHTVSAGLGKLSHLSFYGAKTLASGIKVGMVGFGMVGLGRQSLRFKELAEKGEWAQLAGEVGMTALLFGAGIKSFKKGYPVGRTEAGIKRLTAHLVSPTKKDMFARMVNVLKFSEKQGIKGLKLPKGEIPGIGKLVNYTNKQGDIVTKWLQKWQRKANIKIGGSYSQRLFGIKRPRALIEHDLDLIFRKKLIPHMNLQKVQGGTKGFRFSVLAEKLPTKVQRNLYNLNKEGKILSHITKKLGIRKDTRLALSISRNRRKEAMTDLLKMLQKGDKKGPINIKTGKPVRKEGWIWEDLVGGKYKGKDVRKLFDFHDAEGFDVPGEAARDLGYVTIAQKGNRVSIFRRVMTPSEQFGRKLGAIIDPQHTKRGKDLIDAKNIFKSQMEAARRLAKGNRRELSRLDSIQRDFDVITKHMPEVDPKTGAFKLYSPKTGKLLTGKQAVMYDPKTGVGGKVRSWYDVYGGAPTNLEGQFIKPGGFWERWWQKYSPEWEYAPEAVQMGAAPAQIPTKPVTPWGLLPSPWAEAMARPERPLLAGLRRRPTPTVVEPTPTAPIGRQFFFRARQAAKPEFFGLVPKKVTIPRAYPTAPAYPVTIGVGAVPYPAIEKPPYPEYPEVPKYPPAVPRYPKYPEVPKYPPAVPRYPKYPEVPKYPTYPAYPAFPAEYPTLTAYPAYPTYPTVPITPAVTPTKPLIEPKPVKPAKPYVAKKVKKKKELYKEREYRVPDIWGITRRRPMIKTTMISPERIPVEKIPPRKTEMYKPITVSLSPPKRGQKGIFFSLAR